MIKMLTDTTNENRKIYILYTVHETSL